MCDTAEKNTIILVPQNEEDNIKCIELQIKNPENVFSESIEPGDSFMDIGGRGKIHTQDNDAGINNQNTRCLICFEKIENPKFLPSASGKNACFNIFKEENVSKYSKKFLWQILSEILQKDVKENQMHSKYICFNCCQILYDWDKFTVKLTTITSVLRNTYFETNESAKVSQSTQWGKRTKKKQDVNVFVGKDLFNIKLKHRKPRRKKDEDCIGPESSTSSDVFNKAAENIPEDYQEKISYQSISLPSNSEYENILHTDNEDTLTENEKLHCDSCSFHTYSSKEMSNHRNTHFCSICGAFLSHPKQMRTHLIKVHNFSKQFAKQFECNICHKRYSSSGGLHNHTKTIHGESSYTCKICGRSFGHARLLAIHEVRHKKKEIQCSECEARFYFTANLNKHINSVHRKVRPYQCPICNKYLCQRSALTHHMSQHTNDKKASDDCLNTNASDSNEASSSKTSTEASCTKYLNNSVAKLNEMGTVLKVSNIEVPADLIDNTETNILRKPTRIIQTRINRLNNHPKINQTTSTKRNKINKSKRINQINQFPLNAIPSDISTSIELSDISPTGSQIDAPVVSLNLNSPIEFVGSNEERDEVEINLNFDNNAIIPLMSTNVTKLTAAKYLNDNIESKDLVQASWIPSGPRNVSVLPESQENKKFTNLFVPEDTIYDDENFEVKFLFKV